MNTATLTSPASATLLPRESVAIKPVQWMAFGIGAIAFGCGIAAWSDGFARLAHAYLLAIIFCLSISIGALFFVILQHLTNARWSVTIRRVAEQMTAAIPLMGLMFLPVIMSMFLGSSHLYEWNDADLAKTDELIRHKAAFLNAPFFALRCVAYFSVWTLVARFYRRLSLAQDQGDARATAKLKKYSGPSMLAFALTVNFAAFDLLMSLDPHWFSTIYGVYFFGGCTVAFFAALTLALLFLQSKGVLKDEVTIEHYHDIGKLLFGFVFFWGYIAFSQYLLIWYANIPEETFWFGIRQENGWQWASLVLIVGHFILPFIGLMSRSVRRNGKLLAGWSVFLLTMHCCDLYWLIVPSVSQNAATPHLVDVVCLAGVAAIWIGFTLRALHENRLLAVGDPYLEQSLAFHNA